jgi:very-short-patch-repair endonuclease
MESKRKNNLAEQKQLRRKLRRKSTPEEIALWGLLKGKQICDCQFRRQFSVGAYILDFYCPKAKLCVEIDGIQHLSEENLMHDRIRDNYLESQGIKVLRIENTAIWSLSDVVINTIEETIKQRLNNSPSKLEGVPEGRGRVSEGE